MKTNRAISFVKKLKHRSVAKRHYTPLTLAKRYDGLIVVDIQKKFIHQSLELVKDYGEPIPIFNDTIRRAADVALAFKKVKKPVVYVSMFRCGAYDPRMPQPPDIKVIKKYMGGGVEIMNALREVSKYECGSRWLMCGMFLDQCVDATASELHDEWRLNISILLSASLHGLACGTRMNTRGIKDAIHDYRSLGIKLEI